MTSSGPTRRSVRKQRRFARLWSWLDGGVDAALAPAKDVTFIDLPERVVEIGPGRGSNFCRYRPGTVVVAYEPNRFLHEALKKSADEHGIKLDVRTNPVDSMDLPDGSETVVVSTLVLCSVENRRRALSEIRRVLAPRGRFLFIEHIAADSGTWTRRTQRLLRRPWAALADHCDLTAQTWEAIDAAGFSTVDAHVEGLGPKLDPSRRTVYGVATR